MIVKPAKGLKIRNPRTKFHIPESGIEVPDTDVYWLRRLADGDVIRVDDPQGKE